MTIWSSLFWKDVAERVVATVAQLLITLLSVDGLDLLSIDFNATLVSLVLAAVLVVLKAVVANLATGKTVSPASFATDDRGV